MKEDLQTEFENYSILWITIYGYWQQRLKNNCLTCIHYCSPFTLIVHYSWFYIKKNCCRIISRILYHLPSLSWRWIAPPYAGNFSCWHSFIWFRHRCRNLAVYPPPEPPFGRIKRAALRTALSAIHRSIFDLTARKVYPFLVLPPRTVSPYLTFSPSLSNWLERFPFPVSGLIRLPEKWQVILPLVEEAVIFCGTVFPTKAGTIC